VAALWGPGANHYPGIRALLPEAYLHDQLPLIAEALGAVVGVIDASFSMVTTPPEELSVRQRLPHVDAFGAERIALVHYLAEGDGTAFYRHRSTGFETVDETRAPVFFDQIEAELRLGGVPPAAYVAGDTPLFEQVAHARARFNRALLYPSYLLHSGAISPGANLSADPARGRLTVTGFLALE
jgi:hypothetical protein